MLIAMLDHVTRLLTSNSQVYIITFDYSKAFDTISHSTVASALTGLNINDCVYNWILNYLSGRSHYTNFLSVTSTTKDITAGIVQGSVLGPTLFNITSSTLKTVSTYNKYFKYADDGYLVVPGDNAASIPLEIKHHHNWALAQNLNKKIYLKRKKL